MSSGGGQTTTQTQNSAPWAGAQPALSTAMGGAMQSYNEGAPGYFPGQTVAGINPYTTAGANQLAGSASATSAVGQGAPGAISSAFDPSSIAGYGGVQNIASGAQNNPFLNNFTQAANDTSENPYAQQIVDSTSMAQTPYLDSIFNRTAGDIKNQVNSQFSQAGRYGSGAQTTELTQGLGDYAANLYGGAYASDKNRELQGLTTAAGLYNQDKSTALNAAASGANIYNQDIGNQTGANAQLFGQGQDAAINGVNALGGYQNLVAQGGNNQIAAGQTLQGEQQAQINADVDRYNYDQNADRANVEWLNAIASGQGSLGGTSTGIGANPNYRSGMQNAMSIGGTLASIFALSDRTLKTDIEELGADEHGLPWYRYRYIWEPKGESHIGVMADEAPAHAVARHPSGFHMVDYAALARAA